MARSAKAMPRAKLLLRRAGRHQLAGFPLVDPYQQGEFDGLCGIYAIVNGLRLLAVTHRPLSYTEGAKLYGRGIEVVCREDRLAFAATWGISQTLWRRLAGALCISTSRISGLAIRPVQPFPGSSRVPRAAVFAAVHSAIDSGSPVLVALRGAYNHYTVICGYTVARFLLHDSYAYNWINKATCGVSHDGMTSRHKLATRSILILELR